MDPADVGRRRKTVLELIVGKSMKDKKENKKAEKKKSENEIPQQKKKQGKKDGKKKKKKRGPSISTIILVVIMLAGVGILSYPTVSDWWNSMHATRAIAGYNEAVENLSGDEREAMLEEARAYNESLANGVRFTLSDEEYARYEQTLDVSGTGIMGYIQIPAINVNLPIYHSVEESVLQIAVGHIPGSSLPIGGERTHAVLSGHRGLPSAKLFSDLDQIVEGDIFTVTVLDQTVTYLVDQIRIVLPEEVDDMAIEEGKDYCTLVTCTPYGINTHRMLVRGHRIENLAGEVVVSAEAVRIPNYIVIPAVGIPLLFLLLMLMLIYHRRRGPKRSGQELLDEIRKKNDERGDGS